MRKSLFISGILLIFTTNFNAYAEMGYCSSTLLAYQNTLRNEVESYNERGLSVPGPKELAYRHFTNAENGQVVVKLSSKGNEGWARIFVYKSSPYSDYKTDCMVEVLNNTCPQGWQQEGGYFLCKGYNGVSGSGRGGYSGGGIRQNADGTWTN